MIQGGGLAAVSITFAQYARRLAGAPPGSPVPIAVAALLVLAAVNILGVKPGSRLLNALVILKVGALALLIGGGLLASGPPPPAPAASGPAGAAGLAAFGAALVPILFSYGGWQSANVVSEEIRGSRRTLPVALMAGTAIVVLVYVLVNVVYLRALGRPGLAATQTPAADAVARLFGLRAERLLSAAIAISTFGFLDLTLLAPTRISYAMARDGIFFAPLARIHPRFGTPAVAIGVQALWAVLLVLTGTYGDLVDGVVFADWIFFGLTVASLFLFRRRPPADAEPRAFRAPGYPLLPALFVAAAALVVGSVLRTNPGRSAIGVALLVAGVPVYLFYARRRAASAALEPR
jgi:APA family basic amino acid/polyamine antiporter